MPGESVAKAVRRVPAVITPEPVAVVVPPTCEMFSAQGMVPWVTDPPPPPVALVQIAPVVSIAPKAKLPDIKPEAVPQVVTT